MRSINNHFLRFLHHPPFLAPPRQHQGTLRFFDDSASWRALNSGSHVPEARATVLLFYTHDTLPDWYFEGRRDKPPLPGEGEAKGGGTGGIDLPPDREREKEREQDKVGYGRRGEGAAMKGGGGKEYWDESVVRWKPLEFASLPVRRSGCCFVCDSCVCSRA